MESILRDIRVATSNQISSAKENESGTNLSDPFRVVNNEPKKETDNTFPEPSPEEIEKMEAFLDQLDLLKENDPKSYEEMMRSLGVAVSNPNEISQGKDDSKSISPPDSLAAIQQSLKDLKMKREKSHPVGVEMPNGKVLGKEGVEAKMRGKWITPSPAFLIETKILLSTVSDAPMNQKIYINLCTHEDIDIPAMKKRLNENGESVEGLNIPMSVGPRFVVSDLNAADSKAIVKDAIAYDVIVNNIVLKEAEEDVTGKYRDFICQLCLQYIESKLLSQYQSEKVSSNAPNISIDKRYSVLKSTYHGKDKDSKPSAQYIQDRKNMPKIEVIKEENAINQTKKSKNDKTGGKSDRVIEIIEIPLQFLSFWTEDNGNVMPIQWNLSDYIDPIQEPPSGEISNIMINCEVNSQRLLEDDIIIDMSPFRLQMKVPNYKVLQVYFPYMVDVATAFYKVERIEGFTQRFLIQIILPIDKDPWASLADPGSKPWLIAQALSTDETSVSSRQNSQMTYAKAHPSNTANVIANNSDQTDSLPEDKFHIKLPANVDQYTGVPKDEITEEFPEDRFHRMDASSSFIIDQREQAIRDKNAKHEKEKAERVNDPNVEYIDVEDYKPGGKYGPKLAAPTPSKNDVAKEELVKAAEIVATALTSKIESTPRSTLWTELLD